MIPVSLDSNGREGKLERREEGSNGITKFTELTELGRVSHREGKRPGRGLKKMLARNGVSRGTRSIPKCNLGTRGRGETAQPALKGQCQRRAGELGHKAERYLGRDRKRANQVRCTKMPSDFYEPTMCETAPELLRFLARRIQLPKASIQAPRIMLYSFLRFLRQPDKRRPQDSPCRAKNKERGFCEASF